MLLNLTDEQLYQICLENSEQQLELTSAGVLIILSPVGGEDGSRELELGAELTNWNRLTELGKVFTSSTVFRLPLGGQRSPNAAWVERSRWEALTPEQRRKFPPIAPDFVIELRSATDAIDTLQAKMVEYRVDTPTAKASGILGSPKPLKLESLRHLAQRWDSPQALIWVCPTLFAFQQVLFRFEANMSQNADLSSSYESFTDCEGKLEQCSRTA